MRCPGLRLGADDFLTKDVSLPHLAARVAALFRRIDALRRPDNAARNRAPRALCRSTPRKCRRPGTALPVTLIAHGVLDRPCPGEEPGPRQEPPAIDGCRERGTGRQHHHLAHQALRRKFHRGRCRPSMPSRPSMEWVIAGSSEHPIPTADRRAHHPGAAVGRLPIRPRTRDRTAQLPGAIACWRAPAPSPTPCPPNRSGCSTMSPIHRLFPPARAICTSIPLATQPLLDGYREDWDVPAEPTPLPTSTGYHARAQAGSTEGFLYLFI